ncbi:two-component system OmpR family sensor kinase [Amycolatopsis bartoniae]|uniref:histidine kinase n=1 Tax=Amycolatopsis bartoniae TaxID=941986 RepID=A0A8H9IXP1_9PSEU|nr:HAMP domain-containing sensor histidine kinase [Amycolatopsis bartoniae]MBB2935850.1 two-component system OmpR family sensor kinase [Amycolatopsis bartoniae]TVT04988.1 HAMP domain-containing histidine kinase [Amycolatopsis bartoniae]GHF62301.1 two-component sensor histidine kinase [Amycolatopsis bartoniae]
MTRLRIRLRAVTARLPLRTTLVLLLLALILLALVAVAFTSSAALRSYLLDGVDDRLRQLARAASDLAGKPPDAGPHLPSDFVVVVTDASGHVTNVISAPFQHAITPALPSLTVDQVRGLADPLFTVDSAGGADGQWRVLATVSPDGGSSVFVASSLDQVDSTLSRLSWLYLFVGGFVLLLFAVLAWWLVRRSLRPLSEVEQTAAAVVAGDLSHRVPERDSRTEVGKLGLAFNSMLDRIETSFRAQRESEADARRSEERMRRFIADASHELRTPLASIRGFAELYRRGAAGEVPRIMNRIESESIRLGRLVEDLLLLARLDAEPELRLAPVDLVDLAVDAVQDARALAPDRTVSLDVDCAGGPAVVRGDEHRLRQIFTNLVGNAFAHTPPGTSVTLRVRTDGSGFAVLEVADDGPGLSEQDAARLFERFYRADVSRARSSGGSGLGLAIVAALAAAHGGRAEVDTAPGKGATFRILLPLHAEVRGITGLLPVD